jgi:alpha-glucosidase (family GH31 glycosyl hydrolase)
MFRQRSIPLDVLYLDIDYMDGYGVFTWDPKRFPDPSGLVRELDGLGVKLVTILDRGVKLDQNYAVYTTGRHDDLFCKTFTARSITTCGTRVKGLCSDPALARASRGLVNSQRETEAQCGALYQWERAGARAA